MLERAKSSILPNGNFREFFSLAGGFCVFKTGIPGGPGVDGISYFFAFHYFVSNLCIDWRT